MKYLLFICLLFSIKLNAQTWEWVRSSGSTQNDNGFAVCNDNIGNCYSTLNHFFNGAKLFKHDIDGNLIWEQLLWSGKVQDVAYDGNGNLFALGDSMQNAMLGKIDTAGNLIWKTSLGIGKLNGITTDNASNLFVTGEQQVLKKLDVNGNVLWTTTVQHATGMSICKDDADNFYITGKITYTTDFRIITLIPNGFQDIFFAKFDSLGTCIWAKRAGGNFTTSNSKDCGYAITCDNAGHIYFTGSMVDTADFDSFNFFARANDLFVAKYDTDGNAVWVKQASNGSDMEGRCIAIDNQQNIIVGGSYVASVNFDGIYLDGWGNYDAFVATYDASGNFINALNAGGSLWNEFVYDISIDNNGNTFAVGSFSSGAFFGNDTLFNAGLFDGYVAKINMVTGLDELGISTSALHIFPNPTNTYLTIGGIDMKEVAAIFIIDILGKVVINFGKLHENIINISELKDGVYSVKFITNDGVILNKKLVKN